MRTADDAVGEAGLVLEQDDISVAAAGEHILKVCVRQPVVCAAPDEDAVLSAGIDLNDSVTGGDVELEQMTGIRSGFSSKPQIEVTFDIDVNGVVKVSAKDLGTGREQNITITGSTNLSENEIQRAMADAAAYEAEDSRRKERLELHNQAEVLAYKVDEALSKCKKELDKDEKNRIKSDLANLRRCLRKDKPEKMNETEEANLRQAKSQLEASANHLMVLYSTEQDAGRQ